MSAGGTVGEVLTTLITIGGLLILRDMSFVTDSSGTPIPFFDPAMTTFWFPVLIAVLVALGVLQVLVHVVGRWTIPLAVGNAALQLAFAVPILVMALNGTLINPEFAAEIGWPELAENGGIVMLGVTVGVTARERLGDRRRLPAGSPRAATRRRFGGGADGQLGSARRPGDPGSRA